MSRICSLLRNPLSGRLLLLVYSFRSSYQHFRSGRIHQWPSFHQGFNPDQNVRTNQLLELLLSTVRPCSYLDGKEESGKAEANQNSWKDRSRERNVPSTTTASSNWTRPDREILDCSWLVLTFRSGLNPRWKLGHWWKRALEQLYCYTLF